MNISINNSFNFDSLIEEVASISYSSGTTVMLGSDFSIIQGDLEPSLILAFTDDNKNVLNFSSSLNTPNYSIQSSLGFNTFLVSQINKTTTQMTVSYDKRLDTQCLLIIDNEQFQITNITHNLVLGYSYLTVIRGSLPQTHYRGATVGVILSSPTVAFYDAINGKVKITWSSRDTMIPGIYSLNLTFSRVFNGSTSRWTIAPISIEVKSKY